MIKKILISILLGLNLSYAGDGVNNGGSLEENNILFAYRNIEKYIDLCMSHYICNLTIKEKKTLILIKENLIEEYANKKQILFLSGDENPDVFIDQDNRRSTAITGDFVGSPIKIDRDAIRRNKIDIRQSLSLLIHELGHHHKIADHTWLDLVGAKVASMINRLTHFDLNRKYSNISATWLKSFSEYDRVFSFDQLVINDGIKSFDLNDHIIKNLNCPYHQKMPSKLIALTYSHLGWRQFMSPAPYFQALLNMNCMNPNGQNYLYSHLLLKIYPDFIFDENKKLRIIKTRLYINNCQSSPSSCLAKQRK